MKGDGCRINFKHKVGSKNFNSVTARNEAISMQNFVLLDAETSSA